MAIINGTAGNDTLVGTGAADTISGLGGNDLLIGNGGNDSLDGGTGFNTLRGGAGNDTLTGTANGGSEGNRADYRDVTSGTGITATLTGAWGALDSSVVGAVGVVDTDTLQHVRFVRGTDINSTAVGTGDTYVATGTFVGPGGSTFNEFEGMDGDDMITGNGNTRARYLSADAGVAINLTGNGAGGATSRDGAVIDSANVGTDTFVSGVNTARGSDFADTYVVDASFDNNGSTFNEFEGRDGNDTITGNGHTQARYADADAAVTINLTGNGAGTAQSTVGTLANIGFDTFNSGVSFVRGSNFGDTIVVDPSFDAAIFGVFNRVDGRDGNDTITGSGHTEAHYGHATAAITVTLGAGGSGAATSTAGSNAASIGDDTIISGVNAVRASAFADTITGSNDAAAERFIGGGGNDTIDGGGGLMDVANYRQAGSAVNVDLSANTASNDGDGGTDTLNNIEGVHGSQFDDSISGDGNANQLTGNAGQDTIMGLGGNDIIVGDLDFDPWNGAFFSGGLPTDGGADSLDGGAGADTLHGGAGDDTLIGGAGADSLDGGADFDFASYATAAGLIAAYIDAPTLNFGDAAGDTYTSIEGLIGSAHNDFLIGSNVNGDSLSGLAGIDQIFSFGGNDTIDGGSDFDYILAGEGDDSVDGGSGLDIIRGDGGADTINGGDDFDQLFGDNGADVLNGGGAGDLLFGGSGGDTINGGAGTDFLFGESGADDLRGDGAYDLLQGGDGNDTLFGGDDGIATVNGLIGQGGDDRLIGGTGIDYMTGGDGVTDTGNDTFVFTSGGAIDVLLDFQAGAGLGDVIEIDSAATGISSFAQLGMEGRLFDIGAYAGIIITAGADVVYLLNVASGTLVADDFAFV